jgi:hypothetical protein
MDPNAALTTIRDLINQIEGRSYRGNLDDHAARLTAQELINAVDGLDQWLSRGGFLPAAWSDKGRQ